MRISPVRNNYHYNINHTKLNTIPIRQYSSDAAEQINFGANPIKFIRDLKKYSEAKKYAKGLYNFVLQNEGTENFIIRKYNMQNLEGIQYGIKAFKNMSIKDIQYTSENLHVIAVKRGCKNMCGYCYADAKPQKREMSWEDFTTITRGFKTLRERLYGLDIYGEKLPIVKDDPIYRTTELFYDSDCMDLAIKDKKGKIYDFTDLATELYNSTGRKTVFDSSGWNVNNKRLQERAEKYAQYFSQPENMDKLMAFNISFNTFNASYIASVRARKAGDVEKAQRLRSRFTDNMANTLFTFSPLLENPKFKILARSFGPNAKNAKYFNHEAYIELMEDVLNKTTDLMSRDLNGERKYVKTQNDLDNKINALTKHLTVIDTMLNSSGRMKKFMSEFGIKAPMQNHSETTPLVINDLKTLGRFHKALAFRLIDTDGKVYHMDYARFIPTDIQLNIPNKNIPSPELANMVNEFKITDEIINKI